LLNMLRIPFACTSSPSSMPLLQAFPFPSTLGEVTLHLLSQACMFIYSSRGKWVFPLSCGVFLPPLHLQAFQLLIAGHVLLLLPAGVLFTDHVGGGSSPRLLWSFPPSATLTSFPAPHWWARGPLLPSSLRPGPACLFTVPGRIPFPPFGAQCAPPSFPRVFIVLIAS
jgi:hypothetical protein